MGIRSTMSHLASLSVGSMVPTTSRRNVSSDAISAHIAASSPGSSDSAKRSRRSGSATMSMANISPAAMELLKQQERLQEQERGPLKGTLAISPHFNRPVQSVGEDEKRPSSVQVSTVSGSIVHADEISKGQSRRGSSARHSRDDRRYVTQSDSEKTKGDPGSFTIVTAFNEGEKTTNETLQEVGTIVKDRALNQRFKNLIEQAIAEKESQLDEAGNETMDGDVTLEIDRSLLMGVEEGDEELIDEDDQEDNFGSISDSTGMGTVDRKDFSSGSVGDDDYILDETNVDEHSRRYGEQEKQNTTPGDEIGGDALEATRTPTPSHPVISSSSPSSAFIIIPMLNKVAFFTVAVLATLQAVAAFNVVVPAQERRCFFENLEVKDNLHISYQITDPSDILVEDASRSASATYNHVAKAKGKHQFCFSNTFSTITEKTVGFNVLVIKPLNEDSGTNKVDPLENEIRELSYQIEDIKNEQEYTLAREKTHRNTAESTNSRVVWWSLFQSGILFLVCVFQITYLKRFFEVKRVV
ncbi:p24 complex component [Podila clonocystis]|nr:p24 complex component [Podila clonocystis]